MRELRTKYIQGDLSRLYHDKVKVSKTLSSEENLSELASYIETFCFNVAKSSEEYLSLEKEKTKNILDSYKEMLDKDDQDCDDSCKQSSNISYKVFRNTMSIGTYRYMAPEIATGHYDSKIDIYALGVIVQDMFNFDKRENVSNIHQNNLKNLVEKMLDNEPNKRPNCSEIIDFKNEWMIIDKQNPYEKVIEDEDKCRFLSFLN